MSPTARGGLRGSWRTSLMGVYGQVTRPDRSRQPLSRPNVAPLPESVALTRPLQTWLQTSACPNGMFPVTSGQVFWSMLRAPRVCYVRVIPGTPRL